MYIHDLYPDTHFKYLQTGLLMVYFGNLAGRVFSRPCERASFAHATQLGTLRIHTRAYGSRVDTSN